MAAAPRAERSAIQVTIGAGRTSQHNKHAASITLMKRCCHACSCSLLTMLLHFHCPGCRSAASKRAATARSRCATSSRASAWTDSTRPAQGGRSGARAPTSAVPQARCARTARAWPAAHYLAAGVACCRCLGGACWGRLGLSSDLALLAAGACLRGNYWASCP